MIYISDGIAGTEMKEHKTQGIKGDFDFINNYNPIIYPIDDREKRENFKGTKISKAKLKGKYFISGEMKEAFRKNDNVISRSLIIIDIDDTNMAYNELVYHIHSKLEDYSFIIYPTASHTEDKTKARLILEPNKSMDRSEYETTIKSIGELLEINIDESSKVWGQHMGLPLQYEGLEDEFKKHFNKGNPYPVANKKIEDKPTEKKSFRTPNQVVEGERNTTLFKLASSLQTKNLSDTVIRTTLEATNKEQCNPLLTDKEIDSILNSVFKYDKGLSEDYKIDLDFFDGEVPKFFLVPRNKSNPDSGLKVNVSLLAMYVKKAYDIRVYKQQFRVKRNNYYFHVENMRALIAHEVPEVYRIPSNIKDCEELLLMDKELILRDEELADQRYISFTNGVLNVENMEFKPHSDEVTQKLVFINQVGCNWNPDVKTDEITDLFFHSGTNGNEEDIKYLYQMLGVLISGYRSFKNIFYFYGERDTGKSRYLALAELLLTNPDGTQDFSNIGLRVLTDETSKEFSRIIGKRANIAAETPDIRITNDTLLKQLSGGDQINAQVKFKESVDFRNSAMLIFAGNTVPQFFVSDKSSISERLLIYKFKNRIPKEAQIKDIEKKMNLEYVAVRAVKELREFINNNQEFNVPGEIEEHREEMLQDSDTIYKFYKTCVIETDNPKDRISNTDLYDKYIRFLVDEGHLRTTWDDKPDVSKLKITQYVFVSQMKKYHGESRYKRNLAYKGSTADVFIDLKIRNKARENDELYENFHSTSEKDDKIIKGVFRNSTLWKSRKTKCREMCRGLQCLKILYLDM